MPLPFNPVRAAGLARGLRLIEGGGQAARIRALVRKAGTPTAEAERLAAKAQPRATSLDVYGPQEYERTVQRTPATRYSPEATIAQEAQTRHMADRAPRGGASAEDSMIAEWRARQQKAGLNDGHMLNAFYQRFGWAPQTWTKAENILSPADYDEVFQAALDLKG